MKTIAKKLTTTMLASIIILGSTLPGISKIKAAEEGNIPPQIEMTLEEKQEAFPNIYNKDPKDPWYIKGFKSLGQGILDGVADKLVNTALDQMFGEQDKSGEILDKLTMINGKLDVIQTQLQQVMDMLEINDARKSIDVKLKLYGIVESAANVARKGYEGPMLKYINPTIEQVKKDRWPVLQEWRKLQIENATDSFSSFHYLCDLVADTNGLNWEGDYLKQYESYGTLVYNWDQDMVDFTESQMSRDFYYLSEIAAMNSLYLTYAKENGVVMDYNGYKKVMASDIEKILKKFSETKLREVEDDNAKFLEKGNLLFTVSKDHGLLQGACADGRIARDIRDGRSIYQIQNDFKSDVGERAGYHLMSNDERDKILNSAEKFKLSMHDSLEKAGVRMEMPGNQPITPYLVTARSTGDRDYYHYGDAHWGYRKIYFENYDMSKTGKGGYLDTILTDASVCHKNDEDFDYATRKKRSEINGCFDGEFDNNIRTIVHRNYVTLWVKDKK